MPAPIIAAAGAAARSAVVGTARVSAAAGRAGVRAGARAGAAATRKVGGATKRATSRAANRGSTGPGGRSTTRRQARPQRRVPNRKGPGLNPLKNQRGLRDRQRARGRRNRARLGRRAYDHLRGDQQQQDENRDERSLPRRALGNPATRAPGRPTGDPTDAPARQADPARHAEKALRTLSQTPGRVLRLGRRKGRHRRRSRWRRRITIILTALALIFFVPPLLGVATDGWASSGGNTEMALGSLPLDAETLQEVSRRTGIPTCEPSREPGCVPALEAYLSAAARAWPLPGGGGTHNVDWAILAAIGKKECDHGRGNCKKPAKNHCGARGPMQFLGNTWRAGTDPVRSGECPGAGRFTGDPEGPPIAEGQEGRGYATDGDGDSNADPWNFHDAAHAAARYLVRNGVKADQRRAILAYNNSSEYAADVDRIAGDYREAVADLTIRPGANVTGGPCPVEPLGSTLPFENAMTTPATRAMANAVIACFGRGGQTISCYENRASTLFEHPRGRACDIAVTRIGSSPDGSQEERGRQMAEWVAANAQQLNVLYIVWNDHWWRSDGPLRPWSQWDYYNSCNGGSAGPTTCHRDHVHVSVRLMPGDPSHAHCPHNQCTENW